MEIEIRNIEGKDHLFSIHQKWDCVDCSEEVTKKTSMDKEFIRCPICQCYEFFPSDIEGDSDSNIFRYIPIVAPIQSQTK